jgi:A/G-specific adenine glycosylase
MSTFTAPQIRRFRRRLLDWFAREQRTLPWRGERDPYRILVSEIMLQQTRVAVVEERYKLFLKQFPTTEKLARARAQTVLAAWSGLGYYRRAKSLHAAAMRVEEAGAFPCSASELLQLPGVGRYTAAAVSSIAYGEPAAVVDGNVKRVLSRLTGSKLKEEDYWSVANALLDPERPGDFNQAMMELGALVCLPGQPHCARCPVVALCSGPGASPHRKREVRHKAVLRYALERKNDQVRLRQRPHDARRMAGMWELPECGPNEGVPPLFKLRHSITNTDYNVLVFARHARSRSGHWVSLKSVERVALTGLARKILRRAVTVSLRGQATK